MSGNINNSLVSVIIPAYNHEKYVQEAIQSIIDQVYKNIELIIIDDGSSDATLAKIKEMQEVCENRFARFIVQTQVNQGTCTTLNNLLQLAQGEYIYLIASDDKATPVAIETLEEFLSQNNDYALAVGENLFMDGDSKICYWDEWANNTYDIKKAAITSFCDYLIKINSVDFLSEEFGSYSTLLHNNYVPNGYLIRRSIFDKTGYFTKMAPLEDYYLMLQISKYAKMKYIPKPLFYYRWHNANTAGKDKITALQDKTRLYEIQRVLKNGNPIHKKMIQDYLELMKKIEKENPQTQIEQQYKDSVPKISVLMPVYNGSKYIEETMRSIFNQSFKEFELICIDDSSTDASYRMLNHLAQRDARIKVLQKPNGGTAVKSLIFGLPYAKGDYMFYMSQDDLMSNDLLEKMYNKAIATNADAVIPDMAWYNGPSDNYNGLSGVRGDKSLILSGKEAFIFSLDWTIHGFSLRKMDLVKKLGYDDIAMNSDEYMTRKFYLNSNKVVFSDGIFFYRQNNSDAITKKVSRGTFEYIITHNRIINLMIEANCKRDILKDFIITSLAYIKNMRHAIKGNMFLLKEEDINKAKEIISSGYKELVEIILKHKFYNLLSYKRKVMLKHKKNSLISVLMPAYNHEKYVQEAIQSIIDQSYQNIELIVIDDGSKDNTLNVIKGMKEICDKRFEHFVVKTQANQGTCSTLNSLLEMAQGEYIYIMASDDKALPDALEKLHAFLSISDDYALAVGENLLFDSNSQKCYWDDARNNIYDSTEAVYRSFSDYLIDKARATNFLSDEFGSYASLVMGNYVPNGYLIRANIFEKTGLFKKEAPLEDYYLMLQISKYAKMKYIPIPLFYYRWHGSNTAGLSKRMTELDEQTRAYEIQSVITSGDQQALLRLQNALKIIEGKISQAALSK